MDIKTAVEILTSNDAVRANNRADFSAFLDKLFETVGQTEYDLKVVARYLGEGIQELQARVAALEAAAK